MAVLAPPTLAVWKFASCDGCQLSLLDCEDELLAVAGAVRIAHFLEASRAVVAGPYDVSLVEGSVSTPSDVDRIHRIRAESKLLVAIGACATAGGIQALRNFADVDEFRSIVYARPEYLSTLDNVHADLRARDRGPGVARLPHRPATAARHPGRGADRAPAGPAAAQRVFRVQSARYAVRPGRAGAGCGALCPAYGRGCYGCFGPAATPNTPALTARLRELGMDETAIRRVFATFNVAAFQETS